MEITTLRLIFAVDDFLEKRDAEKVRGYLGNVFWENPVAHHHNPDGSFIYTYPKVQYKIIEGSCLVVAFGEGIEVAKKVFDEIHSIDISSNWMEIHSKALELNREEFGETDEPREYIFVTPWLALNEDNFARYKAIGSFQKRKWLLENILTANLISIAKSLGYTITNTVHTHIDYLKSIDVNVKDAKFAAFFGSFSVNFDIPSFWGIGKSVSRGFGTIIKKEDFEKYRNSIFKLLPEPPKDHHKHNFKKRKR
jgi:hypothetical protein